MRLRTMVVFAAGYAWGAWTGRDRFVELADRARSFLDSELVRDYLQRVQTEPAEVDEFDEAEDEDLEDEELEDADVENVDVEDGEDGEDEAAAESAAADREPEPARSGRAVRRRAPGRARR